MTKPIGYGQVDTFYGYPGIVELCEAVGMDPFKNKFSPEEDQVFQEANAALGSATLRAAFIMKWRKT